MHESLFEIVSDVRRRREFGEHIRRSRYDMGRRPLKSGHGHKKIDFRFSGHWRLRRHQMQWFPNRQMWKILKISSRYLSRLFIRHMCMILKIGSRYLSRLLIRQLRRILKISGQCLSRLLTLPLNVAVSHEVL